jgi:hypothetical protein
MALEKASGEQGQGCAQPNEDEACLGEALSTIGGWHLVVHCQGDCPPSVRVPDRPPTGDQQQENLPCPAHQFSQRDPAPLKIRVFESRGDNQQADDTDSVEDHAIEKGTVFSERALAPIGKKKRQENCNYTLHVMTLPYPCK